MIKHPRLTQSKKPPNLAMKISYNCTGPNKGQCPLKCPVKVFIKVGAKLKKKEGFL